jgi:hypothetical protein
MQAIFMIIQQPKLQNTLTVGLPFTWKLALETSGVPILSLLNPEQFRAGFSWKLAPEAQCWCFYNMLITPYFKVTKAASP